MRALVLLLPLLAACAAAEAQVRTAWESFEWRSRLDGSNPRNHADILEEARQELLTTFAKQWLAQPGSSDQRRARQSRPERNGQMDQSTGP